MQKVWILRTHVLFLKHFTTPVLFFRYKVLLQICTKNIQVCNKKIIQNDADEMEKDLFLNMITCQQHSGPYYQTKM